MALANKLVTFSIGSRVAHFKNGVYDLYYHNFKMINKGTILK